MIRVLFVCYTNTSLSPLASAIMSKLVARDGLSREIFVDSAGSHPGGGPRGVERRAAAFAKEHGLDVEHHKTKAVSKEDPQNFDYILVMNEEIFWHIKSLSSEDSKASLQLFTEYSGQMAIREVADPVLGESEYEEIFDFMERVCSLFLDELKGDLMVEKG